MIDYYKVLGVDRAASIETIIQKHQALIKARFRTSDNDQRKWADIHDAYEVLSDPDKRRELDEQLAKEDQAKLRLEQTAAQEDTNHSAVAAEEKTAFMVTVVGEASHKLDLLSTLFVSAKSGHFSAGGDFAAISTDLFNISLCNTASQETFKYFTYTQAINADIVIIAAGVTQLEEIYPTLKKALGKHAFLCASIRQDLYPQACDEITTAIKHKKALRGLRFLPIDVNSFSLDNFLVTLYLFKNEQVKEAAFDNDKMSDVIFSKQYSKDKNLLFAVNKIVKQAAHDFDTNEAYCTLGGIK